MDVCHCKMNIQVEVCNITATRYKIHRSVSLMYSTRESKRWVVNAIFVWFYVFII